jgi:adenine-specific DNA-methyltransferase
MRDDGAIFISIDDNEQANLRKICDEIFGEDNFVANVVWQKKYAVSNDDPGIAPMHDHVIVFQKSPSFNRNLLPRNNKQLSRYKNIDNDPRGPWSSGEYVSSKTRAERPTLWYAIKHPNTGEEVWPDENAVWRYAPDTHAKIVAENRLYWGPNNSYKKPRIKRFLAEIQDGIVPSTWWPFEEVAHNDEAQKETAELVGKKVFSTPKPVRFIRRILDIASGKDDLILDFFAGSAATAHAVMALNAEDNGDRKFIMVQIPEPCGAKSEALNVGFNTIAEISKERIRRAGAKIMGAEGLAFENLDIGFRVLKIDSSNMEDVFYTPDLFSQDLLSSHALNIKSDRANEDLLFQVLLDWGVELSVPIERVSFFDRTIYKVDENALVACFDDAGGINEAVVREMAALQPLRAVFRDAGFKEDAIKINVEQIFKSISPQTEVKTI